MRTRVQALWRGMTHAGLGLAAMLTADARVAGAQRPADLMTAAEIIGEVPAFENDYVHVRYVELEYPEVEPREAVRRPVVLYVRVELASRRLGARRCDRPLDPPRGARQSWRPGVVPRGVHIDVIEPPPAPSALGEPGTDPPRDAIVDEGECGAPIVLVTFRPFDYGVGTGPYASVTTFLSDGVIEVWNRGLRRRMGVQAGDAFWFEPATRITVIDDYPVGAAIVQLHPRR